MRGNGGGWEDEREDRRVFHCAVAPYETGGPNRRTAIDGVDAEMCSS